MSKVYVVTSGSYSDYRVDGIYSTREKAEEAVRLATNPAEYDIDDWELDPPNVEVKEGWDYYSVTLWTSMTAGVDSKTTCTKLSRNLGGSYWSPPSEDINHFLPWHETSVSAVRLVGYRFNCTVYSDSKERAIKVANERRIMAAANGELRAWEISQGINVKETE